MSGPPRSHRVPLVPPAPCHQPPPRATEALGQQGSLLPCYMVWPPTWGVKVKMFFLML